MASRRILAYAPAALWAAVLLLAGSRSHVPAPDLPIRLDKLAHFVSYGVLGVLLASGWLRTGRRDPSVLLIALGLLVGAADEWHQRTVSGRSSDPLDWMADALGVGAGFYATRRRATRTAHEER